MWKCYGFGLKCTALYGCKCNDYERMDGVLIGRCMSLSLIHVHACADISMFPFLILNKAIFCTSVHLKICHEAPVPIFNYNEACIACIFVFIWAKWLRIQPSNCDIVFFTSIKYAMRASTPEIPVPSYMSTVLNWTAVHFTRLIICRLLLLLVLHFILF